MRCAAATEQCKCRCQLCKCRCSCSHHTLCDTVGCLPSRVVQLCSRSTGTRTLASCRLDTCSQRYGGCAQSHQIRRPNPHHQAEALVGHIRAAAAQARPTDTRVHACTRNNISQAVGAARMHQHLSFCHSAARRSAPFEHCCLRCPANCVACCLWLPGCRRLPGAAAPTRRPTLMPRSSAWALVTPRSPCPSSLQMQWPRQLQAWRPARVTAGELLRAAQLTGRQCSAHTGAKESWHTPSASNWSGTQLCLCCLSGVSRG